MKRFIKEHEKRRSVPLDGLWRFITDKEDKGASLGYEKGLPCKAKSTYVPSVFASTPTLLGYEGVCWYERRVFMEKGTVRLHFGAVMTECAVYLDGEKIGTHYGGFCEFELLVNIESEGEHLLVVSVDNRFDAHSIPQAVVDWYHHGGITRSVTLEYLSGISILSNHMHYTLNEDLSCASVFFELSLYNAEATAVSTALSVSLDGEALLSLPVSLGAGEEKTVTTEAVTVKNIRLWDLGKAELYTLKAETETDDLFDRVGFRKIETKGYQILLNGKPMMIKGVNRHEEHPDLGFAFPEAMMGRDIELIEDMGVNSIRGSHYPNARPFLDLLDEHGICFWSEIPFWGVGFEPETVADPIVVSRGLEMMRDMIKYYYNHPSILIFGMHNEMPTDTEPTLELTKKLHAMLKEKGGNRLTVFASHKPLTDICFEYTDLYCINDYHGWYRYDLEGTADFVKEIEDRIDALGLPERPMIMSEFGAASIYGKRDFDTEIWSENYHAKLLDYCIRLFFGNPRFGGCYIWHFADARTSFKNLNRARGFNNKGIFNEYRKPKLAYDAVKKVYHEF
jgi:beta-glucuronidase